MGTEENIKAKEILNDYSKCELPNIAAECYNSTKSISVLADDILVTEELLRAWLDGTEALTDIEILKLIKSLRHFSKFTAEYAFCPSLSYYNMNKKSHYNKVKHLYIAYEIACRTGAEYIERVNRLNRKVKFTFDEVVKHEVVTRAYINHLNDFTKQVYFEISYQQSISQRHVRDICRDCTPLNLTDTNNASMVTL